MEITLTPVKPRWPILYPWSFNISGETKEELEYSLKHVKACADDFHGDSVKMTAGRVYECKEITL